MRNQTISALLCLTAALTASAAPSPQAAQPAPSKPSVVFLGKTPTTVPKSPAKPQTVSAVPANAPLIPTNFAGWETPTPKSITDPAQADPANASALKEYGFSDAALATYTREGQTIQLKALRFGDASGAYGAYTFYRQSGWPKENIGAGAASDHNRILFWLGNVFVDAQVSHLSAMTASEFRELAASIPQPSGNKLLPPPILDTLPQADLDGQTTHYALGPAAYAANGGVLPPDLIGFDRGAETVTASYTLSSGPATLTIVNYPTPQMAKAAEQSIAAYLKAGNTPSAPSPSPSSTPTPKPSRSSAPAPSSPSSVATPSRTTLTAFSPPSTTKPRCPPKPPTANSPCRPPSRKPPSSSSASSPSSPSCSPLPSSSPFSSAAAAPSIASPAASPPPPSTTSNSSSSTSPDRVHP